MKQLTIEHLAAALLARDNYCIFTHRRPDGDTIGCAAALCRGLRSVGKTAAIFENAQFTPKFRPFLDGLTCPNVPQGATLVAVDVAAEDMLPYNAPQRKIDLLIDHHGSNVGYAAQGLVRPEAAACGEVILELLEQLHATLDKVTAEAIYLAVSTDTGCFRYSNTTERTLLCAARCKQLGADTFPINKTMFMTKRLSRLKLESHLIQTAEFYCGGSVGVCSIPLQLQQELGLTEDDIDDISGFAREIEGVKIGVMLREVDNGRGKISVRTAPEIDAAAICGVLGGGGHAAAAGANVDGGVDGARQAVLRAIRQCGYWE